MFSWFCLIVYCCLFFVLLPVTSSYTKEDSSSTYIHIGLTIDNYSYRESLLLINSILLSTYQPNNLRFHIVACEKDEITSLRFKTFLFIILQHSFPLLLDQFEIVPFYLPEESGFYQQLKHAKHKSHWNSPIGADMIRFYLPSLFPKLPKILYLDNDIIITCCLEDIYATNLQSHVIGLALDHLSWAVNTQFIRHYNASHPLVIYHMRTKLANSTTNIVYNLTNPETDAILSEEFSFLVQRYPNDGVLLFNISAYNQQPILFHLNQIALANAQGEYVVNMGTQQYTVLTMHNLWLELTPRANLRHFPSMARGYLMWFIANGFIHYAGTHKPKHLCYHSTFKYNNILRTNSFYPWLFSNYQLYWSSSLSHKPTITHPIVISKNTSTNEISNQPNIIDFEDLFTMSFSCLVSHIIHPRNPIALYQLILDLLPLFEKDDRLNLIVVIRSHYSDLSSSTSKTSSIESLTQHILQSIEQDYQLFYSITPKKIPYNSETVFTFPSNLTDYSMKSIELYPNTEEITSKKPFITSFVTNIHQRIHRLFLLNTTMSYMNIQPSFPITSSKHTNKPSDIKPFSFSYEDYLQSLALPLPTNKHFKRGLAHFEFDLCEQSTNLLLTSKDSLSSPSCHDILTWIQWKKYKHWNVMIYYLDILTYSSLIHILESFTWDFIRPMLIILHYQRENQDTIAKTIKEIQSFERILQRNEYLFSSYPSISMLNQTNLENNSKDILIWGTHFSVFDLEPPPTKN